jgi:pimeloyl-ACP methyl ester carboxylesterase
MLQVDKSLFLHEYSIHLITEISHKELDMNTQHPSKVFTLPSSANVAKEVNRYARILLCIVFLIFALLLNSIVIAQNQVTQHSEESPSSLCTSPTQKINQEKFVLINGIEQWITIKGDRCDNPVILFLHGGPANPMSPYADAIYGAWQKDFTVVHWDQRGGGKTFIRNPKNANEALTMELMVQDGVAVAQYLRQVLAKDKVILMGGSWGSALGLHMVKARDDLFFAYIGTAQIVSQKENQAAGYRKTLALARASGDPKMIQSLEEIGSPPWLNPRNFGVVRRATKVLEAKTTTAAPKHWWKPAASYQMDELDAQYEAGEEYSFLQFVGFKNDGMYAKIDFPAMGFNFKTPLFLVQGEEDLVTVPEVSKAYFDQIQAPEKAYVLLAKTGHNPNQTSIDAEFKLLKERVLPLTQK